VLRTFARPSILGAVLVGIFLGPALAGFGPVGNDPEILYRPIKLELARALAAGRLPYWSDRMGLGVPLVAESHAAAFYPPNWLFYRLWDVGTAYRLSMGLHLLALAGSTFAYARILGISRAGSAMASVSFALCGFQAAHAVHEPFYHLMPYVPLCLLVADLYARSGRPHWLAFLALAWGIQITLGHFQIQMWTAGLVIFCGGWRALAVTRSKRRSIARIVGLLTSLCCGAAVAWVQLRLTWELSTVAGFVRPMELVAAYAFPPALCAQFALPEVFLGIPGRTSDVYWSRYGASASEACAYAGIIPLILAFIGAAGASRSDGVAPWRMIIPLSLALATMPGWWPDGFALLLQVPGIGWFRAPSRYTLLASLGLALLAGRALDHSLSARCFRVGIALALATGAVAWYWSLHSTIDADFRTSMMLETLAIRFAAAGLMWALGFLAIVCWRWKTVGAWVLISITVIELGVLFFVGPVPWGRSIRLPDESPMLRRLAALPDVGLVAGRLMNLPLYAGQATAYPLLGIVPPPPNYLLERTTVPFPEDEFAARRWQRRFGVTHGVWGDQDFIDEADVIAVNSDPALDQVVSTIQRPAKAGPGLWKLVRYRDVFPAAWVVRRVQEVPVWGQLYWELSRSDNKDTAWFIAEDAHPSLPEPIAQVAGVTRWDSEAATVEHDGSCILIMRRTFYPGWVYQVDGGAEQPVFKVNGGLQGALLVGPGISRVTLRYRPNGLAQAATVSLVTLSGIALVFCAACWAYSRRRSSKGDCPTPIK
jgi:hypothetical protein